MPTVRLRRADDGKLRSFVQDEAGAWVLQSEVRREAQQTEAEAARNFDMAYWREHDPRRWREEVAKDRQAAFVAGVREHPEQYQALLDQHYMAVAERERREQASGGQRVPKLDAELPEWQARDIAGALFAVASEPHHDPDPVGTLAEMQRQELLAKAAEAVDAVDAFDAERGIE